MADAQTESIENVDQCLALTGDGERCSRPAQEDGFCFQHDEDDPTVDEKNDVAADSMEEAAEELAEVSIDGGEAESATESEGGGAAESEAEAESEEEGDAETGGEEEAASEDEEADSDEESTGSTDEETADDESEAVSIELDEPIDVTAIRDVVQSTGGDLIGHPLDAVIGVSATDDGWRAVVEVVERHAVPDTQDILGQYELLFDEDGTLQRYHRLERFRRGDAREEVDERFER